MIGLTDSWAAYQFDLAVAQFGAWVEGRLGERDSKGKPKHTLAQLLSDGTEKAQYLPLAGLAVRMVRIKEDGTWDED